MATSYYAHRTVRSVQVYDGTHLRDAARRGSFSRMPQGKKLRKSSLGRKKRSQPYQKRGKKAKQVRKVGAKDGMAKRNAKFSKFKNKKVTGKINLNIESIMAAKVLRNRGGLRMGDLKTLGQMTDARLKAVQQEKDSKKRVKPARPEKVYQPRI